jgi:hypothetical protein
MRNGCVKAAKLTALLLVGPASIGVRAGRLQRGSAKKR